tara:strand:+ start:767 stop:1204 length:438 start_codon:yes stop_codon:yes gene_type:complete
VSKTATYYPYPLSIFIVSIIYWLDKDIVNSIKFSELLNSTMVVFSVLFGFLLTVSTLLYTIDTKIMKDLRKTDGYKSLVHYLKVAIYGSLLIAIISLCVPLFKSTMNLNLQSEFIFYGKYLFLFLIFLSLILSIRFIHVFINTVE